MKNVFLLSSVLFSLGLSLSLFASQDKLETQYQSLVELFFDAARIGNNEVVETFVSQGFPIDQRNKAGLDLKTFAEIYGQSEVLKSLQNK
ncbi:hypothetical protein U0N67_002209 [Vibrio parahaemolyticus]|nr:hypothetical protein [Vibrio parahaemolyticus]ELZ7198392.1 hypothetical protein [Vibrio parahaemolyticus]MBE3819878.1 hypothetical protein [Vibrio parahaemolyticus]MBM5117387.1 hypothetical protein [Vibrio parahaemolyticus]MBM5121984.1 hypothetical protein [Vibrio parahaemolyticus]